MKKNILIVEDNVSDAWSIEGYLEKAGYGYEHVTTYTEAIESLKNSRFDAVLLDINLNDYHDGVSLGATIDTEFYLPYIFITGQEHSESIYRDIADLKYKNFIYKPIREEGLISNLKIVLEANSSIIKIADNCIYDIFERKVFNDNGLVTLSVNETNFLGILAVNKNRYVSRGEVWEHIWGDNSPRAENALRALKSSLLSKLDKRINIVSDNNHGYKLSV